MSFFFWSKTIIEFSVISSICHIAVPPACSIRVGIFNKGIIYVLHYEGHCGKIRFSFPQNVIYMSSLLSSPVHFAYLLSFFLPKCVTQEEVMEEEMKRG